MLIDKQLISIVKDNPAALAGLSRQTAELCLAAVQTDGMALQHVRVQTPDICRAAVRQNPKAWRFVRPGMLEVTLRMNIDTGRLFCDRRCFEDRSPGEIVWDLWGGEPAAIMQKAEPYAEMIRRAPDSPAALSATSAISMICLEALLETGVL